MFPAVSRHTGFKVTLVTMVLLATAAAGVLAYGTDPYWGQFRHGVGVDPLRPPRTQGLMAAGSLLMCLAVVGLIVGGGRRVFWLPVHGDRYVSPLGIAPGPVLVVARLERSPPPVRVSRGGLLDPLRLELLDDPPVLSVFLDRYEIRTGRWVSSLRLPSYPSDVILSPDGTRIAYSNDEGELAVADAVTGRQLLMGNADVRILYSVADRPSPLYRNAIGDELVYVESGSGVWER